MSTQTAVVWLHSVFGQAALSLRRSLERHWPSDASGRNQVAEANITHHLFSALLQSGFHVYPEHPVLDVDWGLREEKQRIDLLAFHDQLEPSPWIAIEAKRFWEAGVRSDVERLQALLPCLPGQEQGGPALACVTCFSRGGKDMASRQEELGMSDWVARRHPVHGEGADASLYLDYAIFRVG